MEDWLDFVGFPEADVRRLVVEVRGDAARIGVRVVREIVGPRTRANRRAGIEEVIRRTVQRVAVVGVATAVDGLQSRRGAVAADMIDRQDRKSTRLNSSH